MIKGNHLNVLTEDSAEQASVEHTASKLTERYYALKSKPAFAAMTFKQRMDCAHDIMSGLDAVGLNSYRVQINNPNGHSGSSANSPSVNLASNNYLNFTRHPDILRAASAATEKYGIGSGSVPMLAGTLRIHRELESRLATFTGYEAAITYGSGYAANYGLLTSLLSMSDVAILDTYVHSSINEGCATTNKCYFLHNDPDSLRSVLQKSGSFVNKLVIVDGVYSMDGDIARLPEIISVARDFGAMVLVDESHAIGVIGKNGMGTASHWNLVDKPDFITCSMGKALGATGGFVAGPKQLMSLLELTSKTFIYSTSLPPGIAAGIIKAIDLLEKGDPSIEALWDNIHYFRGLIREEWPLAMESKTAIFPLIIQDEVKLMKMAAALRKQGIFVVPIFYPVVPRRKSRMRISLSAAVSKEELGVASDRINLNKALLGIG